MAETNNKTFKNQDNYNTEERVKQQFKAYPPPTRNVSISMFGTSLKIQKLRASLSKNNIF